MALENVKKFYEKLNSDEELQNKVKAATEAYTGDKSDEKAVFEAVVAPVAKEAGYEFTFDEAAEAAKEVGEGELSDEDAAVAAGGLACLYIGFGTSTGDDTSVLGKVACKYIGVGWGTD